MSELITKEDWEALKEVLGDAIKKLDGKRVESVKLGILEFVGTATMLGLQDLADVCKGFERFLLETVAVDWDAEAVATLSFSMGALLEKMQLDEYGPKFSSGLSEIALSLQMYNSAAVSQKGIELSSALPMALEKQEEIQPKAEPLLQDDRSEKPFAMHNGRDMGFVMDRVDWFKQIMRNDPNSLAFVSLAEELCFRNQWSEAAATCRKGLAIHPSLTRGRVLMGWALWELGKVDEAEQVLLEAKSEMEANGIVYKILGEISNSRGDSKSARIYAELFQSIMPQSPEGLLLRAAPRRFEDQPVPESPPIVEFLRVLLQRFETKKPTPPREYSIFSDADRLALRHLLTNTMH